MNYTFPHADQNSGLEPSSHPDKVIFCQHEFHFISFLYTLDINSEICCILTYKMFVYSTGIGQPNSNFSTPYNTINRPKYSQGYDDTTLASRRGNGYTGSHSMMGSDPRLVQGHSNPALDQHGDYPNLSSSIFLHIK